MNRTEELMSKKGKELIEIAVGYGITINTNKEKTQLKETKKSVVEKIVKYEAEAETTVEVEAVIDPEAQEAETSIEVVEAYTDEEKEAAEFIEKVREADEPEKVINDYIYRSLPKYVQKVINYCDYVDGVYCIHLNTEYGMKEVAQRRWDDAKKEARSYCKRGK